MHRRSFGRVKYHLVHLTDRIMKGVRDVRFQFTIQYLGYLPDIVLLVALGLGMYAQWSHTRDIAISVISLLGLFVFAVSCALRYYFSMEAVGNALFYVWTGCLTGIVALAEVSEYDDMIHQVMDMLFLTSMVFSWFWNICSRFMHLVKYDAAILSQSEALESLGLAMASTCIMNTSKAFALSVFILAFAVHIVALRMKSFLGFFSFLCLLIVGIAVFFPDLDLTPNKYALAYFVGRHTFQPIIDFYFSALTSIERWKPFFNLSRLLRYIIILFIFCLNLILAGIVGIQSSGHKEWFIVVPIFIVFVIFWLVFHVLYTISSWKLMTKITDCTSTYMSLADDQQSFNLIMAAKGVRHFSLITQRLICLALTTTVILIGVGWETRSGFSLSLAFIILPIEAMSLSLFWALGDSLGGTCAGFAIIAPVTTIRPNGPAKLLSSSMMQEITTRATSTLNNIHKLFTVHMIDNFGCDYSTSGMSQDYLKAKVNSFFEHRTTDGPRYDTYLMYYSGDVFDSGELALADNTSLKPETLLEWWSAKNVASGSRLILVLDIGSYASWSHSVRTCRDEFVALQTCKYSKQKDVESSESGVGSFTKDWVSYSFGKDIEQRWTDKSRSTHAVYVTSKLWTDFTFHLPTQDDFAQYWDANFPKVTKPLIKAVNLPSLGILCCVCTGIMRCLRRKQMKWVPPKEIDTGHGFKLVRT